MAGETADALEELSTAELHDRAVARAERHLDVKFFWSLLRVIPAAETASGDAGRGRVRHPVLQRPDLRRPAQRRGRARRGAASAVHRLPAQAPRRLERAQGTTMRETRAGEGSWSEARAERRLRSLELFGMRFGLDRMRAHDDRARLARAGLRHDPGARHQRQDLDHADDRRDPRPPRAAHRRLHLSASDRLPRTGPDRRARARRRRPSAPRSRAPTAPPSRSTARSARTTTSRSSNCSTAAALWEMARREVQVGVVEAGLGGRYDATSVVQAAVTVLTNVGLEHTRWLGPDDHRHRRGEARRRAPRRDARAR